MGRLTVAVSLSLFVCLVVVTASFAAGVQKYSIGSGAMGGGWQIGVGAAVQMLNEQLRDKYSFTAAASGGSVENIRRMITGEYQTVWVHTTSLYDAWNGVGLFEGQKPFKDIRAVEKISDNSFSIVCLAKSPIRNFMDLAGKRVNFGPAGSGGVPIARAIFKTLGLTEKMKISNINFQAAAQALKDGQMDVTINPGSPYVMPATVEIARSVQVRIIEPSPEEVKRIEAELPYLSLGVVPADKAPGENSDRDRKAFFWCTYWVALKSLSDGVVYDMLKITQEPKNREILMKVSNLYETAGPEFEPLLKIGIPMHPGAVKFWKEQKAKLPAALLK